MRIIQLTAGTGSFYCGTCIRDNALVTALRDLGHDATMVPMYLPLILDETSAAAETPLFYGGVNVYLQEKVPLFRKTPRWLDRMFDTPALLDFAGRKATMTRASQLGELTVSTLRGEDGRQSKELARLVEWIAQSPVDVICLSNILLIGLAKQIKAETGASVVCTLQGEDTFLDSLPAEDSRLAWDTIAERVTDIDAFVAVSKYHGDLMRKRAQIPADRIHVVHNGISLDGYPDEPPGVHDGPPVLGYLARMYRPKGLETLVDAYLIFRKRDRVKNLKLHVARSQTEADIPFVSQLKQRIDAAELADDFRLLPNIDRDDKIAFLCSLSVLSVPATYGESFGLYVIEAMAAGVPVVQPRHAAFPELIEATGGGVLCEPDDPEALAIAIEELLLDPQRARELGAAGQRAVRERFSVEYMAKQALQVFETAVAGKRTDGIRV